MVWMGGDGALREVRATVGALCHVHVPDGCRIIFARGTRSIIDVVEVGSLRLLQSSSSACPDSVDVMAERVCDQLSLVVVEGRVARDATLAGYRVCYAVECEAVVIRSLYMD